MGQATPELFGPELCSAVTWIHRYLRTFGVPAAVSRPVVVAYAACIVQQ